MTFASTDVLPERQEVREQVREGIDSLSENYRIFLVPRDIEEFNTAETLELHAGELPGQMSHQPGAETKPCRTGILVTAHHSQGKPDHCLA